MSRKIVKYSSNTPKTIVIKKIERRTPQGKLLSVVNMKATYYGEKYENDKNLSKLPIFLETEKIPLRYSPIHDNKNHHTTPIFIETERLPKCDLSPSMERQNIHRHTPPAKIILKSSKPSPEIQSNRRTFIDIPGERTEYILTGNNGNFSNNGKSTYNDSLLYGDVWSTTTSGTQVRDSHIITRNNINHNNDSYISQGNIFDEYVSALNRINHYRLYYYNLPSYAKLSFSEKLMKEAKIYCYEKLMRQNVDSHSQYQTNVWTGSANFLIEEVIDEWFNEMKFWKESNFRKEHFRYIGIGIIRYQRDNTPMMLVVCLYE
ncbi:CAP domain-containing protein [Strongyloides ratti]|uniref:CAP domain-containing protein n=1 Tax=Strongyloides ratti TaxID=34506 RepID=A0A090L082_STRRB|nr:CAP domain-containing protein [Strongyloides ratti]CEF63175.1 CAP domain-containing protein [Strongyloides ratti]